MEQSPLPSPSSDPNQKHTLPGRNGGTVDSRDPANQRMIADRLLAALANANLDHLAQAREAFLKDAPVAKKKKLGPERGRPVEERVAESGKGVGEAPPDLEALLERRTAPRSHEDSLTPADQLRREDEELKASLELLRNDEQDLLKQIADTQTEINEQQRTCHRLEGEARQRSERAQWLSAEIESLKKAEQEQLRLIEETEARLLAQFEARHHAATEVKRHSEKEKQLNQEIELLTKAEHDALARVKEAETRVQALQGSLQTAAAALQQQSEKISELQCQIVALEKDGELAAENIRRANDRVAELNQTREQQKAKEIGEARAALPVQEETHQRGAPEARQFAPQTEQRLTQLRETAQRLDAEAQQRHVVENGITAQIEGYRAAETEQLKHLNRLRAEAEFAERKLQENQTKIQGLIEKDRSLKAEIEGLRHSETDLQKLAQQHQQQLTELRQTIKQLETQAEQRAANEQSLILELYAARKAEAEQVRRIEDLQAHLQAQVKACYLAESEAQEHAERAEQVNIEFETVLKNKEDYVKRVKEAESRLRVLEETRHASQVSAQRCAEKERQLNAEIEALRQAEEEQIKRIEAAEIRLREQQEARQSARSRIKELAEQEQRLIAEVQALRKSEVEHLNRIKETEARLPAHQEALRQAEAQAQRKADEEIQKLSQLEAVYEKARAEDEQRAARERRLNEKFRSIQSSSTAESNLEDVADPEIEMPLEVPIEENAISIMPPEELTEKPWPSIDFEAKTSIAEQNDEIISAETTADLIVPETNGAAGADAVESAAIPADIAERLQSADSSQRAAALVDLAEAGGEESFALITKFFDDPSVEVRNAAARALCNLQPDLGASFTRALRDSTSERRRKIGAAIAASGLAANAINSLAGERRDPTYSAFSILFLMAKAGEVQPLMQTIAENPNIEVRLTSVKLLALSNQQQVLPGLRTLAARDVLPPEVHTAVMEAIYQLSAQSREVA